MTLAQIESQIAEIRGGIDQAETELGEIEARIEFLRLAEKAEAWPVRQGSREAVKRLESYRDELQKLGQELESIRGRKAELRAALVEAQENLRLAKVAATRRERLQAELGAVSAWIEAYQALLTRRESLRRYDDQSQRVNQLAGELRLLGDHDGGFVPRVESDDSNLLAYTRRKAELETALSAD